MLANKTITIAGVTVVDEKEIAKYGAVLDVENDELSFYNRTIDSEACKEKRDIVRADRAEFEDFAYHVQEVIKQ